MRSQPILLALLLSCSALAWACGDAMPPPATPTTQTAPVTTVVLDAGTPIADPAPVTAPVPSVATASTTPAADPPAADAGAASAPSSAGDFFSCSTAADCVAVPKNDCCKNGYKESVNKSSVDAYRASAPACNPKRKCPMFRIMDKRVADCSAGKCVLVQPDAGAP
jgi:hypothetical protein